MSSFCKDFILLKWCFSYKDFYEENIGLNSDSSILGRCISIGISSMQQGKLCSPNTRKRKILEEIRSNGFTAK